jgi:methyl-accepting chemotaxis protein
MTMLGNVRISFKLMAMSALAFIGIAAIALLGLVELKANLLEDRKAKLRDVVELAVQNVPVSIRKRSPRG